MVNIFFKKTNDNSDYLTCSKFFTFFTVFNSWKCVMKYLFFFNDVILCNFWFDHHKGPEVREITKNNGIAETRGIILTITLVAAVLLVLNVILISCYVRRKAERKRLNGNNDFSMYIFVLFFQIPFICHPRLLPRPRPRQPPRPLWTWWWAWL